MNVKIDTKEKFSVITPVEQYLAANMTDELRNIVEPYLKKEIPHLVLNMCKVEMLAPEPAELISNLQQTFYENDVSLVICELNKQPEKLLDEMELLEFMNVTPTESEAWDIVQMEEIERELMNGFDEPAS
jgi:anti-anti-sigma regulatory factor